MNLSRHKNLEHPRMLFFLGSVVLMIGIACGSVYDITLAMGISIIFGFMLVFFGGWKSIYTVLFIVLISLSGAFLAHTQMQSRDHNLSAIEKYS